MQHTALGFISFLTWAMISVFSSQVAIHERSRNSIIADGKKVISTQTAEGKGSLEALMELGTHNHLPIGIVLGSSDQRSLCTSTLHFGRDILTQAELVIALNSSLRSYHARFVQDVLVVEPQPMPEATKALLRLKLPSFETAPDTQFSMGMSLWNNVHAQFAPLEGFAYAGGAQKDEVIIRGFTLHDTNVEEALNHIASLDGSGAWLLSSAAVKTLDKNTTMPFRIYNYHNYEGLNYWIASCVERLSAYGS